MTIKTGFITFSTKKNEKQPTFEIQLKQLNIMVLNNPTDMLKVTALLQKIVTNPYVGVFVSLLLIIPSLYIILEDITVIRKEYIFLAIGIPIYIKSLNKIFDNMLNLDKDLFK